MSDTQEQWTNEDIGRELDMVAYGSLSYSGKYDTVVVDRDDAMELLIRVRHDLTTRLAAAERERDTTQPLWTNEMIYQWSDAAKEKVLHKNRVRDMISSAQAEGLAETIRDDYAARLRSVQAESDARALLANVHGRRMLEAERERDELRQELAELRRVVAYIDSHAPRADASCDEPGITLSAAARRTLDEMEANDGE